MAGEGEENTGTATTGEGNTGEQQGQVNEGQQQGAEGQQNTQGNGDGQSTSQSDGSQSGKEGEGTQGAPEQYADFSLPEGFTPDEGRMQSFSELAQKHNLSQEAAQAFVTEAASFADNIRDGIQQQFVDTVAGWVETAQTDPEITEGGNMDANLGAAMGAIKAFGDDDLNALLDYPSEDNPHGMALGNNPAFIRFALRVAKRTGEDKAGAMNKASGQSGKSTADVLFGDS